MNTEELLHLAALLVAKRLQTYDGTITLLVRKGELKAVPKSDTRQTDIHVACITNEQARNGFSAQQWNLLGEKLSKVYGRLTI